MKFLENDTLVDANDDAKAMGEKEEELLSSKGLLNLSMNGQKAGEAESIWHAKKTGDGSKEGQGRKPRKIKY